MSLLYLNSLFSITKRPRILVFVYSMLGLRVINIVQGNELDPQSKSQGSTEVIISIKLHLGNNDSMRPRVLIPVFDL